MFWSVRGQADAGPHGTVCYGKVCCETVWRRTVCGVTVYGTACGVSAPCAASSPPNRSLRCRGPNGVQPAGLVTARTFLDGQGRQLDVRLVEKLLPLPAPFETVRHRRRADGRPHLHRRIPVGLVVGEGTEIDRQTEVMIRFAAARLRHDRARFGSPFRKQLVLFRVGAKALDDFDHRAPTGEVRHGRANGRGKRGMQSCCNRFSDEAFMGVVRVYSANSG